MNNKLKAAVYFEQVNKLVDTIYKLNKEVSISLYIDLSGSTKDGERLPMVKEYVYKSNYNNMEHAITIKRRFIPYIGIDYPDEGEMFNNGQIRIYYSSIIGIRDKMRAVEKSLSKSFTKKGGVLYVTSPFEITTYPSPTTSIRFIPVVITDENNKQFPGLNLLLNCRYSLNISIERFEGFRYLMETCDLYGWASTFLSSYTGDLLGTKPLSVGNSSFKIPEDDSAEGVNGFTNTKPISNEEKKNNFFNS